MVRIVLFIVFGAILLVMVAITAIASLDRSVFDVGSELLSDRWFQATLCDAYCAFLAFYVWVAYKEPTTWRRLAWFVLIGCLGSIAIAVYMLIQLARMPRGASMEVLLVWSRGRG